MQKRTEKLIDFKGFSKGIVLVTLLILTLALAFPAYGAGDADHRGGMAVTAAPSDGANSESGTGFVPDLSTTKVERSSLITELHYARRAGDEDKVREIEARLPKQTLTGVEAAGPVILRPSTTFGGAGDRSGDSRNTLPSVGQEATFGTDIHVRGPNNTTKEWNQAMASDSNGNLYVAWQDDYYAYDYIQLYWSGDGGQTWVAYGYVQNASAHLKEPSIAIGEGSANTLLLAYIVDDGSSIPYPEVATTPLGQNAFTIRSVPYLNNWEGYAKPVIWTDSYDWSGWYAYLTCEGVYEAATNNINVCFWRSTDGGAAWNYPSTGGPAVIGNLDDYAWRDADGTYGTTLNRVFLACYNDDDNTLYSVASDDFGYTIPAPVAINTLSVEPINPVDPDIEAATGHNNVMIVCTKSFDGNDNIGQTYSADAGNTWPNPLWSLDGYTTSHEFAPELTANEGGGSWHVAFTSNGYVYYSQRPQDLSGYWQSTPDQINDIAWASQDYPKKGIASNWATDVAGIAWADFRDGYPDYDTYFDYDREATTEPIIRIEPTSLTINQAGDSVADSGKGEFIPVVEGAKSAPQGEPMLGIIRSDESRFEVKLATAGMFVEEKAEGGDNYKVIHLGRYNGELPPGQPNLPAIRKHVYVPKGKSANLGLTLGDSVTFTNYVVYPTQLPQMDTKGAESPPFYRDEGVYSKDQWFPKDMVSLGPVEIIRGHAVRLLSICPFQYNPARKILRVFPEINAQILFNGQEIDIDSRLRSPVFDKFIKGIVVNPGAFAEGEPGMDAYAGEDYLIITAPAFETQANALAAHKTGLGISTGVVTTVVTGATSTQIKAYIQNAYDTYAPTYVLLLGDVETIPTTYDGTANTGTDLYYSTVDGADYVADLFLGRISVDTVSEAQTVINKIINYETNPPPSPSFYTNAVVAAYFQDGTPYVGTPDGYEDRRFVRTSEEVRDFLLGEGYNVERIYCAESGATPTNYNNGTYGSGEPLPAELLRANGFAWDGDAADISAAINAGVFLMMHRDHGMDRNDGYSHTGWGDPYYVETHVDALTNGDLLPVVMSINCQTGWFDGETDHHASYNYESFCELFLRKSGGGAVGVFGATRNSYSGHNDFLAEGMIDSIWPDFLPTVANSSGASAKMGPMLNHGKLAMDQLWGDPWGVRQLEYELFHVFGDPSLEMWTDGNGGGNTFTIYNDGTADLEITSMAKRDGDAWLSWTPTSPITIAPGGSRVIAVSIDWGQVSGSSDDEQIVVYSNDVDMSPYPTAVYITANKSAAYRDELALDFGASGVWDYDGASWAFITGSSPEDMTGWSDGLAMDFGASGLWNFDGTTWTPISGSNVQDITDWANGLAVDFGASGVWNYDGSWASITGSNPDDMAGWSGGLAMDFGASGVWSYDGTAWSPISGSSPEGMLGWSGGLAMDFGASGLWSYDGTTWDLISGSNVEDMADWSNGLSIDFGASGVWNYDGTTWAFITGSNPEDMLGWASGLAVDFGASGLWSYDGTTWAFISGSNVEDMDDVDLY